MNSTRPPIVVMSLDPPRYRVNTGGGLAGTQGLPVVLDNPSAAAFVVALAHQLLGLDPPDWGAALSEKQRADLTAKVKAFLQSRHLLPPG